MVKRGLGRHKEVGLGALKSATIRRGRKEQGNHARLEEGKTAKRTRLGVLGV